jgi:hypothetical protein
LVINALCIHSGKELKDSISCLDPLRVTGLNLDVWADWLALPPRPSPARCENELALRNEVDGYRALAFKAGVEVRLLSRNRTLFNDNYPALIDALKSLKTKPLSSMVKSPRCMTACKRSNVRVALLLTYQRKDPGRWGQGITPAVMKRCHGSNRCWSPRSSLRSGPATVSFVSRSFWACERTNRQRMSFVNRHSRSKNASLLNEESGHDLLRRIFA